MQRKANNSFLLGILITLLITGVIIAILLLQLSKLNKQIKTETASRVYGYMVTSDVKSGSEINSSQIKSVEINSAVKSDVIYTSANADKTGALFPAGQKAKVDLHAGTILTKDLTYEDEALSADARKVEYNIITLPSQIQTGDYIDVRLTLPGGQDYIVVSHKEVEIPTISGVDSESCIWMQLSEAEILTMSSAIVEAYQMEGGDMGVTGQSFVFADKDGWVSEEGMPNKIWVGEAVKYVDRWYKINPVDDSVEGMPNLTIQRDFTHKGTLSTSVNGYVTFNGKQYKTWNDQTNVDGDIIIGSVRCLNTDTMTEEGQIKVIAMNENGTIYNDSISTAFRYGYVAGNSEKKGLQFIRSYVSSRDGQAADEEFAVVNYFDKTEAGQVVALNPIT